MMEWTVYLAAPIDQAASVSVVSDTRELLKATLHEVGATVYDPYRPRIGSLASAGTDSKMTEQIRLENIEALRTCDGVLAYLPDGVPSIGVPVEIERAVLWNKPIAALGGDALMSTPMWEKLQCWDIDSLTVPYRAPILWLKERVFGIRDTTHREPSLIVNPNPPGLNVPTSRPKAIIPVSGTERAFFELVLQELIRAEAKHPERTLSNSAYDWFGVWIEEMVEAVQAFNDRRWPETIEELVQVGAMTQRLWQAMVEAMDAS